MGIRATCGHCGRDFYFCQVYGAPPADADRCPHCARHLGVPSLGPLAARADRALAQLVGSLRELDGQPRRCFTLHAATLVDPVADAGSTLASLPNGAVTLLGHSTDGGRG